jgi:hypothetical protein
MCDCASSGAIFNSKFIYLKPDINVIRCYFTVCRVKIIAVEMKKEVASVMPVKPAPCLPVLRQNRMDFRYYFYPTHCKITSYIDIWL